MSKSELKDQLKSLESYFNDVPLVLDPCKMCKNYDEEYNDPQFLEGRQPEGRVKIL